jgi:hypothetical protein
VFRKTAVDVLEILQYKVGATYPICSTKDYPPRLTTITNPSLIIKQQNNIQAIRFSIKLMPLHSLQPRSTAEKLQRSSILQTIQTLLAKLIAEELTVQGRLDQESKQELKLVIDAVVDQAWRRAESHAFGPKLLASKVTQLVISCEDDSIDLEAKAKTLVKSRSNRLKHSPVQKEWSFIEVKRLDFEPNLRVSRQIL